MQLSMRSTKQRLVWKGSNLVGALRQPKSLNF